MEEIFQQLKGIVEKELSCSVHRMDHVLRVYNLSLRLAEGQEADLEVLQAAALLHDIGRAREDKDSSGSTDHAVLSAEMAAPILEELGFFQEKIPRIIDCILTHRYRTGSEPKTVEAKILFDADKLDAVGAIGVARSFMWAGSHNSMMHSDVDINDYIRENLGGDVNGRIRDKTKHTPFIEFETKLKRISARLYTERAKQFAEERMEYMRNFFDRMKKEIDGEF